MAPNRMTNQNNKIVLTWIIIVAGVLAALLPVTTSKALAEQRLRWCPIDRERTPRDSIGKDGCTNHPDVQVPVVDDCRTALTTKGLKEAQDYFSGAARWDYTKSLVTGSDADSLLFQNMYSALLYRLNKKQEAQQVAEKALGKGSPKEIGGANYTLGMLALDRGDTEEAENLLRKHLQTPQALFGDDVKSTLDTGIRFTLPAGAGDATVLIDGKKRALTKDGFALAGKGWHVVTLSSKRYKDFQQKVDVNVSGEAKLIEPKLLLRPITLNLTCDSPSNARFSLKSAGLNRVANGAFKSEVPEGQYTVRIEAPHYDSKEEEITVRAGDGEVQKNYSLERLGEFGIDTGGIEATFQLGNNAYSGRSSQTVQDIRPGTYHLLVTPKDKKRYRSASLDVVIAAGKPLIQPITLRPATGSVLLTVQNVSDYQVEVDGSPWQSNDSLDLTPGEHSVVVKARGYKDVLVPVNIQPGTPFRTNVTFTEPHDRAKAQAYVKEGVSFWMQGQNADAERKANEARDEDAIGAQAYGLLAMVKLLNKTENAHWVNEAISRDKSDALALTARGAKFLSDRQYEKARGDFEQAVKANPDLALAHWLLGEVYYAINKVMERDGKKADRNLYISAETHLEKAVAEDPKSAGALLSLSKVYITMDKADKAIDLLMRAVETLPDPAPVSPDNAKGECYARLALAVYNRSVAGKGKKEDAIPYLEKAKQLRYVGVGKQGYFDLYDLLKISPPR